MVITVGSTKGGVGKTTIAVNLAVGLVYRLKADVLLIDGDEQGHSIAFTELRSQTTAPIYTAVALHGAAIRTQVRQLRDRYDHTIIDVGGRDTGSLRAALTVSDLVIIPAAPRSFDLWGADSTAALVAEARELNPGLRAIGLLNGADPSGKDNTDALRALGELEGIEVFPIALVRRKAYPNAASKGYSVLEYSPASGSAREEFSLLLSSLFPAALTERKSA